MSDESVESLAVGTEAADEAQSPLEEGDAVQLGELVLTAGDDMPSRDAVEPYLAALLQVEHLNLLVGSGLTTGLAAAAGCTTKVDMVASLELTGDLATAVEQSSVESARVTGRGAPNVEDRLRVALAAAEGLRLVGDARAEDLDAAIASALTSLRDSVAEIESCLAEKVDDPVAGSMTLGGLLMTFLGAFAGRAPTRDRLHVFSTNYDRVIEWGAELAGLRIVDRFVGSLQPVFRSSRLEIDYHYSPPGSVRDPRHLDGVFRLTKLHGSLDWQWEAGKRRVVRANVPFGAMPGAAASDLLIYPNAAKDVETSFYPYSDVFRDYSAALCRPHSALVTYGYSFGDDHINRIIKDMLTIPSTHLLVISFDDASGRIRNFAADHRRLGQVSLMIGPPMASLNALVDNWLPWPSAEFLLQRRARIYRDRDPGPGGSTGAVQHETDD